MLDVLQKASMEIVVKITLAVTLLAILLSGCA